MTVNNLDNHKSRLRGLVERNLNDQQWQKLQTDHQECIESIIVQQTNLSTFRERITIILNTFTSLPSNQKWLLTKCTVYPFIRRACANKLYHFYSADISPITNYNYVQTRLDKIFEAAPENETEPAPSYSGTKRKVWGTESLLVVNKNFPLTYDYQHWCVNTDTDYKYNLL